MSTLRVCAIVLPAAILLGACGDSGGGGPAPGSRVSTITSFDPADWQLLATNGAQLPESRNGQLVLESRGTSGSRASAAIRSRVRGQYTEVGADVALAFPGTPNSPPDYDVFLDLGIRAEDTTATGTPAIGRHARIGLVVNSTDVRRVIQITDSDGNPIQQSVEVLGSRQSSNEALGQTGPTPLRIVADLENEVVRFFVAGALAYTYVPTALTLPVDSTVTIEATGREFDVRVDGFQILDADSTEPTLAIRLARGYPLSREPGRVEFVFNLRDETNGIIALDESQLVGSAVDFAERRENDEGFLPIDRIESNPLFKRARLPQDVVILLDFSRSMATNGAIPSMVQGAKDLARQIWSDSPDNRIQVWEFHDSSTGARRVPLRQISPPPPDNWLRVDRRSDLEAGLDDLAATLYNGFSPVFDAVSDLLQPSASPFREDPRGALQSIVFLGDGFDTGSSIGLSALATRANDEQVALYPIAFQADPLGLRRLRRIAAETDGALYAADEVGALVDAFRELGGGLDSLYSASYVSGGRFGLTRLQVEMGLRVQPPSAMQPIELAAPLRREVFVDVGDSRIGSLEFDLVSFSSSPTDPNTAVFRSRAVFVPRGVATFKVGAFTGLPQGTNVTLSATSNGLLGAWDPFRPSASPAGAVEASGPELLFGDFGGFIDVTVTNIPAGVAFLQFSGLIYNDIYPSIRFATDNGSFESAEPGRQPNFRFFLSASQPTAAD